MRTKTIASGDSEVVEPVSKSSQTAARTKHDELTYLADMVRELSAMAGKLGCPTLAGILTLAGREAQSERDRS